MTDYVKKRDEMIVFAERYANQKCGASHVGRKYKSREEWAGAWNKTYFGKMDALVKATQEK